jgi:hypothetical protein
MATTKTKDIVKAFIDIGKVPFVNEKGVVELQQEYVVVPEEAAKYMKVKYTTMTPKPSEIVRKDGKKYTREVSVNPTGVPHKFGFIEGINPKTKALKVKWITIRIPRKAKLRTYIAALRILVQRKPSLFKMPSGKSVRLFDTK